MNTVTITKKEYEDLLKFKKTKEFTPTSAQKKALARAEANLKKGKTLSLHEISRKLGLAN